MKPAMPRHIYGATNSQYRRVAVLGSEKVLTISTEKPPFKGLKPFFSSPEICLRAYMYCATSPLPCTLPVSYCTALSGEAYSAAAYCAVLSLPCISPVFIEEEDACSSKYEATAEEPEVCVRVRVCVCVKAILGGADGVWDGIVVKKILRPSVRRGCETSAWSDGMTWPMRRDVRASIMLSRTHCADARTGSWIPTADSPMSK
mmetsp:Transcript_10989/g.17404  ORF Transcript_10989/g.17404 Transcript_10989/m.17404 type:complete len:203 (+) Transcript_10989:456-1064(+)